MISSEALAYYAGRILNTVRTEAAIDWAMAELCNGKDSPTLRILAGLSKAAPPSVIDEAFQNACRELGYAVPSRKDAIFEYVVNLARQVKESKITAEYFWVEAWLCYSKTSIENSGNEGERIQEIVTTLEVLYYDYDCNPSEAINAEIRQAILDFLARADANPKSTI